MIKRLLKPGLIILMSFLLAFTSSTNVFAATSTQKYISDLILCSASSEEEAEQELKSQGYKLMSDTDLNASLSEGMYLGYKTTTNKDEAITDIKALNMNGDYSFTDYEELMEKLKSSTSETVDGLIPMISAYKENCEDNNPLALEVKDILNKFYEDDSKQGMGDYLIACSLTDTTDLTKVFMQGYSPLIICIEKLIFLASGNSTNVSWIQNMSASDSGALYDQYLKKYHNSQTKATKAIIGRYGDDANTIRSMWDSFYETLQASKTSDEVTTEMNSANDQLNSDATIENVINSSTSIDDAIDSSLVSYLKNISYNGSTMYDFFNRPAKEVNDDELYTLAYFMGEDLIDEMKNVGLEEIVTSANYSTTSYNNDIFNEVDNLLKDYTKVSIYEGVDRSLYENGIALTGASVTKQNSSGKSWSDGLFDRLFQPSEASSNNEKWYDYLALYVLPTAATALAFGITYGVIKVWDNIVDNAVSKLATIGSVPLLTGQGYTNSAANYYWHNFFTGCYSRNYGNFAYKLLVYMRAAFFVLMIALVVVDIVMLFDTIASLSEDTTQKYLSIPSHIVDTVDNGGDYVAYNPVMNTEGTKGDLYDYKSKSGWLMLYYSKESSLGDPITTDMEIVTGSTKSSSNYENVSLFDKTDAVNLTSKTYTGVSDQSNGTYMYFRRDNSNLTASAFTTGSLALAVGVGAIVGILGGWFLPLGKKKKLA